MYRERKNRIALFRLSIFLSQDSRVCSLRNIVYHLEYVLILIQVIKKLRHVVSDFFIPCNCSLVLFLFQNIVLHHFISLLDTYCLYACHHLSLFTHFYSLAFHFSLSSSLFSLAVSISCYQCINLSFSRFF